MEKTNELTRSTQDWTAEDLRWIRNALELAERGWGIVDPNPLVGAIVVRDGTMVGSGYHAEYGGPHAEVVALRQAGAEAEGATLYLTLEPCAHHGKTPPCTEAVLESGVTRVVIAAPDPNPLARGGIERLREAGLEVVVGVEEERARALNAIFYHRHQASRPYLALKYGLTLDARISERPDRPTQITGAAAHAEVHRLRAGFQAIMVGSGTAEADDPLLTVRGELVPRRPPARVIIDTEARLSPKMRLFQTIPEAPLYLLVAEDLPTTRVEELEGYGAEVIPVPRGGEGLDLEAALDQLGERGIDSIFCEGGGRLGSALLQARLVDRLYLFYAPFLLGGDTVPAFPGPLQTKPNEWIQTRLETFDNDFLVVLDRRNP